MPATRLSETTFTPAQRNSAIRASLRSAVTLGTNATGSFASRARRQERSEVASLKHVAAGRDIKTGAAIRSQRASR